MKKMLMKKSDILELGKKRGTVKSGGTVPADSTNLEAQCSLVSSAASLAALAGNSPLNIQSRSKQEPGQNGTKKNTQTPISTCGGVTRAEYEIATNE